ncbi:MAG: carbohydrate ABC transporter permease [Chloroflexi bacterium]|nr:carbohydrate ABC transporter permease [Chloroflexota bacterium]
MSAQIAKTNVQTRSLPARKPRIDFGQTVAHGVLILFSLAAVMPFVWMFLGSFKTYTDLASNSGLPNPWIWDNYVTIMSRASFPQAFLNSVLVAVPRVVLGCFTSVAVAYVFAKYKFPGQNVLFTLLLSTMMVPFVVVLIPLYITLSDLGMVNQLTSLIIIAVFSTFGTFLLRQSIRDIPNELIEAARIDGAGEIWIFSQVILPLSTSPLAALAIFTFLGSWDDFLFPGIILTTPTVKTLPLVLAGLRGLFWDRYELFAAGSMMTVAPVMLLYAIMQKQFVRGIALTGMK